ncbi:MAG: radical SAM protein [Pirellulales bacterium]|nr:radical SAM protein [Pirellulales bacterium]
MSSHSLHSRHERSFEANRFVYPVLSRRAGGLSIGVNLNPDKICNFNCIYCQVDRTMRSETRFVAMDRLLAELDSMLQLVVTGQIWQSEKFQETPQELRRLNDIAFSGDGEPTTYRNFDEIIASCAALLNAKKQADPFFHRVKLVLITNASQFHKRHVVNGLAILDTNQGEIWAKLDAGTEAYYRRINRAPVPFQRIVDNITAAAQIRPLVIQSLFMRIDGQPPPRDEIDAYCDRLATIQNNGGRIQCVQVYTVARTPAEPFVTPLGPSELDAIADRVRRQTGLPVTPFTSPG